MTWKKRKILRYVQINLKEDVIIVEGWDIKVPTAEKMQEVQEETEEIMEEMEEGIMQGQMDKVKKIQVNEEKIKEEEMDNQDLQESVIHVVEKNI